MGDRKPVIGIVSLYDEKLNSWWLLPGYAQALEEAGAAPLILPLTADEQALGQYAALCDGFLFPGGHDVDPALYGGEHPEYCGPLAPERDEMERRFFPMVMESGKPFLGICRGVQLVNVLLGGTLYMDLPKERPSGVEHHGLPPYDQVIHTVAVEEDSPLYRAVGLKEMGVNSYHHQGVKDLGRGLKAAAYAPDGLPEALYLPDRRFALAVQWHPEFSYKTDENSRKIFRAFTAACGEN